MPPTLLGTMAMAAMATMATKATTRRGAVCDAAAAAFAIASPCLAAPLETVYDTRPLDQQPVVDPKLFKKTASGARYADLYVGTGPEVVDGSRVSLQWVLRRSNGYFVDSSLGALSSGPQGGTLSLGGDGSAQFDPFVFTVGDGRALLGIDEGVRGMRQGGRRRLVLPIKTAYTSPVERSAGPLPSGYGPRRQIERELAKTDPYNYFFFEVEATKVK